MMSRPDADILHRSLSDYAASRLDHLEVFDSIGSTNTHLLAQPPPAAGRTRAAIADQQTAGRGRHDNRWVSPAGAGLYLSIAYTFAQQPGQLSALTLALGVGVVNALSELGIDTVSLKWPNDIVALNGKLGGVLTETQPGSGKDITVVTGVGLNIELPEGTEFGGDSGWAPLAVDLKSIAPNHPSREVLAATLIDALTTTMLTFEELGFAGFVNDWKRYDWLRGRNVTVEMQGRQITGVAAGVNDDGALLVDTGKEQAPVISGSIVIADGDDASQ